MASKTTEMTLQEIAELGNEAVGATIFIQSRKKIIDGAHPSVIVYHDAGNNQPGGIRVKGSKKYQIQFS